MGVLDWFAKPPEAGLSRLPQGSFTVDSEGRLLASTLPQTFPKARLTEISKLVLETFLSAHRLEFPLNEFVLDYGGLKLTAREMRGGAIIFLSPRVLGAK